MPALVTACLWCALAAGVVYWWLHFPREQTQLMPAVSTSVPALATDPAHMARALGQAQASAVPVASAEPSRFQLLGVISSATGHGSALIAVDGQPPKAWRVGQALQEGVYLQKLSPRQAWLGPGLSGPAQWTLQMAGPGSTP